MHDSIESKADRISLLCNDFGSTNFSEIESVIEKNSMPFFIGNIPSYLKQPLRENMIDKNILLFYHYCPAWNDALLLEYLLEYLTINTHSPNNLILTLPRQAGPH